MIHIEKEIFVLKNDILEISEWQANFGVYAGFSTRLGGVGIAPYESLNLSYAVDDQKTTVQKNREILASKTPIPLDKWIFAEQKHTTNIKEVTTSDCGRGRESFADGITNTDGLYTKESGIMLATFHADCTPVYFVAKSHNLIGIVHAGWQGTINEVSRAFVKEWFKLGVKAKDIQVVIGPGASQASYLVGTDVAELVANMELETARDAIIDLGNGKFKLDTPYLNYLTLCDLDIPEENMVITSYCSICDDDLFFSFRRDGETGRMLAFISQ